MENGFSTSDAVLTAAMSGGLGNRGGGGSWGNSNYGSPFADLGSNAIRIDRNAAIAEAHDNCTKESVTAGMDRISAQNFEGRFNAAISSITDGQFQAELRNGDRLRDVEKLVIDGQKEAAICCCDSKLEAQKIACATQKLIIEKAAITDALILAVENRGIERNLNAANAELTALKSQIACGCCPPRS